MLGLSLVRQEVYQIVVGWGLNVLRATSAANDVNSEEP